MIKICLQGLKTEKNLLVGALRGLESKLQPFYQPPLESDDSDSEDGDEEMSNLLSKEVMPPSPPNAIQTPTFSRTLSAIESLSQSGPSTSATPVSQVEKLIPQIEKSPAPDAATTSTAAAQIPKSIATAMEMVHETPPEPTGPPPVTRPLSTFSRTVTEKEKPSTSGPPPVTQPLSTFARSASVVEAEESSKLNLSGHKLYICCNAGCDCTCEASREFGDHLMVCAFTNSSNPMFCVHCGKTIKTVSKRHLLLILCFFFIFYIVSFHGNLKFLMLLLTFRGVNRIVQGG